MNFSSPLFLFLFLPVVLTVNHCLPGIKARNAWLLAVSLLFYAWGEVGFIVLLAASTLMNHTLGRWLEKTDSESNRKRVAAVAIIANLALLAFFKYTNLLCLEIRSGPP
jgi:alginate O-acetyltransferase complex protein AlgI